MPINATEDPYISDDEFEEAREVLETEEADINFLDIELPDAAHFSPSQLSDDRYDVLRGARGTVYEGRTHCGQKDGSGKLWDAERIQYIDGEWKDDRLIGFNFAQFQINDTDFFRLNGLDDLITSNKHHFVARIIKQPLDIFCDHFPEIRRQIETKITITKILDDDLKNELQICREKFEMTLKSRQEAVTKSRQAQRDIFYLFLLKNKMERDFDYEDENENMTVLRKIYEDEKFSQELRNEAKNARKVEQNVYDRNRSLPIIRLTNIRFSWKNFIKECINESIRNIRKALQQALPNHWFIQSGQEDINKLQYHQLFTCSIYDIQLFSDLEFAIQQHTKSEVTNLREFAQKYISQLWELLIKKINNSFLPDIPNTSIYTNSVFLQLVKTFLELLDQLCKEYKLEVKHLVTININGDLQMAEWPERNLGRFENRLEFLIHLMNHFKPGDIKNYEFKYEFFFFATVSFDNTTINIIQEYAIWLYYVHSSFCSIFCDENAINNININKLLSFLDALMSLIKTLISNHEISFEKIRILANSIIKFGTTITPYFLEQSFMNEDDMNLLLNQAEYIKDFVTAYEHAQDDLTSIVDIYQVFWDERKNLFTEINRKYPSTNLFISEFNKFMKYVFNMKIYNNKFLIFLRACNEFIRLTRGTNFPWYVTADDLHNCEEEYVTLVDDKVQSYLVENTENFLLHLSNISIDLPRHYLLEVTIYFIKCVQNFLDKNIWNVNDKMQASSELLLLMGRSLISVKKLPNAIDFDKFFADFTEPFDRVTMNSFNINDFKRRLSSLENYYKYVIELNVMSVSKALEHCRQLMCSCDTNIDYTFESTILESCYNVYLKTFNTYVDEYILMTNFNIKKLSDKVKSTVKSVDISKWDSKYKTNKLPELLAGLSAVWSALESRDIICQKKVIKPHCIQILCILRLLGVDKTESGFESHLAQVLTGQGKSIILSLLAAILALTGNRVRIVCYNKYLVNRDKNDFQNFYKTFNIENNIKYGTFNDMANEILTPEIKGKTYTLRDFVRKLTTGELDQLNIKEGNTSTKTVLLIDEVDVFFSSNLYGNTFDPCVLISSEDIAVIQLKIWNLTETTCNKDDIRENIQNFINEMFHQSTDNTFKNIVKNSRTILNIHVDEMISNAISVRNSCAGDWHSQRFKLLDDGRIITLSDSGEHIPLSNTLYRYSNIFMYFKLKKIYDHEGFDNYGYLNVHCGNVSYAMLPKDYHSILGVTGTLRQLSDAEMRAVTSYNITRGSDMPTFFGKNNLRITNFTIMDTVDAWITAILDSILSYVQKKRAVIVFFEDEQMIDSLRDKFATHLSRYSVLTGNESAEEVATCVEEAGIACKVTIATRWMGRGVDFKSNDSAVEAKGGVHVIQTFWSEDEKEETQIKGRTARKDNSGSYESVLCREHLTKAGYEESACSYNVLNKAREQRIQEQGTKLEENINKSQKAHEATMEFLRSFFNYNPKNRLEYFQKYPFINIEE